MWVAPEESYALAAMVLDDLVADSTNLKCNL